jgi:DNA-binding GntR family transcriptional regulator
MDVDPKTETLDRSSFEPAYMQIVRIVSRQIAAGILHPGDQLPVEKQFCEQYNVSPMTVRRAMNILVERGLVGATQGKGTFVKPLDIGKAVFRLQELKEHWTEGNQTTVKLLKASILSADKPVAHKLTITPGERVVYIGRLVLQEGTPTIYHREYLVYNPRRPVVEAQLQITSLAGLLQGQSGEGLKQGHLTIEAVSLNDEEACVLQIPQGSAAFRLEHIFYDFSDRPVSWGWFICRADRYNLTTCIGADAGI